MLKKSSLVLSLGAALGLAVAIPAGAADFQYTGSEAGWEVVQPAYSTSSTANSVRPQIADITTASERATEFDGFRYTGGEGGWRLASHHYVFSDGGLAHTSDCDHTVSAKPPVPTTAQIEATNRLYGGA